MNGGLPLGQHLALPDSLALPALPAPPGCRALQALGDFPDLPDRRVLRLVVDLSQRQSYYFSRRFRS